MKLETLYAKREKVTAEIKKTRDKLAELEAEENRLEDQISREQGADLAPILSKLNISYDELKKTLQERLLGKN